MLLYDITARIGHVDVLLTSSLTKLQTELPAIFLQTQRSRDHFNPVRISMSFYALSMQMSPHIGKENVCLLLLAIFCVV